MATPNDKVRILLIRPWTEPLAPFRAALRAAGIHSRISRVDIATALDVALSRGGFDLVILDPSTPKISHEIVEARLHEHRCSIPIVVLGSLDTIGDAVKTTLVVSLN